MTQKDWEEHEIWIYKKLHRTEDDRRGQTIVGIIVSLVIGLICFLGALL